MRVTMMAKLVARPAAVLTLMLLVICVAAGCENAPATSPSADESTDEQSDELEPASGPDDNEDLSAIDDRPGSVDVAEDLPEFSVRILASATEGNAPMDVDFSVEITSDDDVDANALSYQWSIGPLANYDVAEFRHSFYAPTVASVDLTVTYRGADGSEVVETDKEQIRVLGCADLMFEEISLASPVEVGQGESVSFLQAKMLNEGDVIETPFEVWVVLSDDDILDLEVDHVVSVRQFEGMESGQFGEVFFDLSDEGFDVPGDLDDGNYYVYLVADAGEVVNECQESNNIRSTTNNLTVDASLLLKPDLEVTEVGFPENLVVKQDTNINYSFRVSNVGDGDAEQFRLATWLSVDDTFDPDSDMLISGPTDLGATVQQMAVEGTQNFFKSYKIPVDLTPGEYWIIVEVDVNEQVAELDETNNVAVSPFSFTMQYEEPQCADLSLDALQIAPTITYWNGTVQVLAEVSNPGTMDIPGGWSTAVYFSLQPSLNPSIATQMNTSTWVMPSIPAGETVMLDEIVTVKNTLPVLEHYVGLVLDPDDVLSECAEGNNAKVFETPIEIEAQANVSLVAEGVSFHPNVIEAGEDAKVTFSVSNMGSSQASSFGIAVVLSADNQVSTSGIAQGLDVVIGELTVPFLPPATTLEFVEKIPIPIELDAVISQNVLYTVGVVVDPTNSQVSDSNKSDNVAIAPSLLQVTGAQGGCLEDGNEPNNALETAVPLAPGSHTDLHSCGNTDWYTVNVPTGHSLHVTAEITPLLSLDDVPSNLDMALYDPGEMLVDESTHIGPEEELWAFVAEQDTDYALRVYAATPNDRGHYTLHVEVLPPVPGVELVPSDVEAIPASLYPGGLMNLAWTDNNMGDTPSPAYDVAVWLSTDQTLDAEDISVAVVPSAGTGAASSTPHLTQFLLPSDILGGDWYFLVQIDPDGVLEESDTENNVAVSDVVFLDPQLTCADDDNEPNDAPVLATPLDLSNGSAVMYHMVACPQLPDWYRVSLEAGNAFVATATYQHDDAKGLLTIELWDPTGNAMLWSQTGTGSSKVQIPWVWSSGDYLLKVATQVDDGKEAPYTYNLSAATSSGLEANRCDGDVFEDNNWMGGAATVGCGLQSATLCQGDVDYYDIIVNGGDTLTVTMQHAEAGLKMSLYADMAPVPVDEHAGNGQVAFYASAETALLLVVEADGDPTQLISSEYTIFLDGVQGSDLIVDDLGLYPGNVDQGEDGVLSYTLRNTCIDATPPFDVTVWLSADAVLDETDVDLKTFPTAGVDGKSELSESHKVSVPFSTVPGMYWLLTEADSSDQVNESNEGNNVGGTEIGVTQVCLADAFEPNDLLMPVEPIAPLVELPGAEGLSLCPLDVDWFQVVVPAGKTLTASITFENAEGDLDLRAYDPAYSTQQPVASSQTSADIEAVSYMPPVGGVVLLRVNGFDGAGASYGLQLELD
ncbi:MAG: CARDB domain-containing protein [Myxococcota bacterium]